MRYRRRGPIGPHTPLNASFINGIEERLVAIPAERPYERRGPFSNGQAPGITLTFLNGMERFLSQVGYQPIGPIFGSGLDIAELFNRVEDCLVSLSESRQYEDPLVEYDYERA